MNARLTASALDHARAQPGQTALLFITDNCPVGCAHCSVDSRPDSPRVADISLFEEVVSAIAALETPIIGISGGEPFVERRALTTSVERLADVGKSVVIYTSGVWAASKTTPTWIQGVLRLSASIVLSTDAFHTQSVDPGAFVRAAQAVQNSGAWLIVQVLDLPEMIENATRLLVAAFGDHWDDLAEIKPIPPLPYGRGQGLLNWTTWRSGSAFPPCNSLSSRVFRYDGEVMACCNERVIMRAGPSRLRRPGRDREEIQTALRAFEDDVFLQSMNLVGPIAFALEPQLSGVLDRRYGSICETCWALAEHPALDAERLELLRLAMTRSTEGTDA